MTIDLLLRPFAIVFPSEITTLPSYVLLAPGGAVFAAEGGGDISPQGVHGDVWLTQLGWQVVPFSLRKVAVTFDAEAKVIMLNPQP